MSQGSERSILSSSTSGTQKGEEETLEEMQERLAYWKATMEAEKNEERKAILKHLVTRISEQVEEEKKKVGGRHRRRRTLGRRARGRRGFKKFSKTRKHRK